MVCPKFFLPFLILISFSAVSYASNKVWSDEPDLAVNFKNKSLNPIPSNLSKYRYLRADMSALKAQLQAAPMEVMSKPAASTSAGVQGPLAKTTAAVATIELPLPDGDMRTFVIEESPIMEPQLAEKYPEFKTYRVISSDNSAISGRLDLVSTGFHAYLSSDKGTIIIDPDRDGPSYYRSFYKHDYQPGTPRQFSCGTVDHESAFAPASILSASNSLLQKTQNANQLLNYRLAVAATEQYSQAVAAGNITDTQAEIATAINRVNEIYERDLGIRLVLVANNDSLISTNPVDILSSANDDENVLIDNVKPFIESKIDVNDYDIGHAFSTGAGGLAQFQGVCTDSIKAEGVTGIPDPVGDIFYIDFVAHEIGHQFGANHTFNGTTDFCSGINRNAATAYEPGSGSTIMAYAGICGAENVQFLSDATFHAGSITAMVNFTRTGAGSFCDVITTNANAAPVANAGIDRTVPGQTPLQLVGSATDLNGDTLLYQWDEMDVGTATTAITYGSDLGNNALFRSFLPTINPVRTLPRMSTLVSGINDKAEKLPTTDRALKFRLTVRDQNLGVDDDDIQITVDKDSGPFRVVSAASPITLDVTQPQVIEWDTACTEQQPVNCANVDISVSTNAGVSFTPILVATPNDGAETINFPPVSSTKALIKVACTDNIFFDINDSLISLALGSGSTLTSTGFTSSTSCVSSDSDGGGGGSSNPWFLLGLIFFPLVSRGLTRA